MFRLSLSEHELLCEDLKKFISALLPHEASDNKMFSAVLSRVTKLIPVEEMELEYYLTFKVATELEKIYFQTGGNPVLSRDVFESTLTSNMYDIVKEDKIGIMGMLERNGMPSNLSVEGTAQEAMNMLMRLALDLYDECFELSLSPEEALGYFVSLRANYISAVGTETIRAQAYILNSDNEINSRRYEGWRTFLKNKNFLGAMGWKDFVNYVSSELALRLREATEDRSPLHTLEQAEKLRQEAIFLSEIISSYGIPPIDMKKGIVRSNYTVLIGKRGLGKTTLAVNFLVNVFLDGKKVLMINEETRESSMLYEYIIPVYIFKRFGFFASYKQILGEEEITGCSSAEVAERKKMIQMAIIDFTESGRYMYVKSVNAWKVYDELAKIQREFDFDYCVIDHTLSMPGGGETTPRLESLSKGIKEFKSEFGKHVLLLSHTAPKAAKVKSTADMDGLTKYATQIEGDADDIFYAYDNEQLEARGLIAYVQTKGRGAEKELSVIYLSKIFAYKLFKYDPQMQDGFKDSSDILGEVTSSSDFDEEDDDGEELI